MKNIKISVIIPNWNSESTLENTIHSCLNQTLSPLEVLVCDDGSTDNSKQLVESIKDERVRWIPGVRTGTPATPRNNGMRVCKGEWIAFCDSDDTWLPDKLEKQIESSSSNLASCTNAFIKKDKIITKNQIVRFNKKKVSFANLLSTNYIICSSAIIHHSIFKKIGGFPEDTKYSSFEDYIYWLRVATETHFSFLDIPLVIYDDHPETSIRSIKRTEEQIKKQSLNDFIEWAKVKNLKYFILSVKIKMVKFNIINKVKQFIKNVIKK